MAKTAVGSISCCLVNLLQEVLRSVVFVGSFTFRGERGSVPKHLQWEWYMANRMVTRSMTSHGRER